MTSILPYHCPCCWAFTFHLETIVTRPKRWQWIKMCIHIVSLYMSVDGRRSFRWWWTLTQKRSSRETAWRRYRRTAWSETLCWSSRNSRRSARRSQLEAWWRCVRTCRSVETEKDLCDVWKWRRRQWLIHQFESEKYAAVSLLFPPVRHHSVTPSFVPLRLVSRQPCGSAARSFSTLARHLVAVRWRPWKRNKTHNKLWGRPSRQF